MDNTRGVVFLSTRLVEMFSRCLLQLGRISRCSPLCVFLIRANRMPFSVTPGGLGAAAAPCGTGLESTFIPAASSQPPTPTAPHILGGRSAAANFAHSD